MARRQPTAPDYWFDGGRPPLGMRALSAVYAGAVAVRRRGYRLGLLRSKKVGCPVVIVGNLIAGGSGKTPLVIAVVQRLREAGFRPGVASRGYGRDQERQARWVDSRTPAELAGDEPLLIAVRTGVPVRVDRDRVAAARALLKTGCDVVVCDDGLQHYRLHRDIEVEVIDARRRYGNGHLLPAGPLREPAARSEACDFRVLNAGESSLVEPAFGEWPMRLQVQEARPLLGGRPIPLRRFAGQRVHAVAGIGDPERFFATLRSHGVVVVPHAFPDHHRYRAGDFEFGSDLPILMTEKDAVKCLGFAGERYLSVPARATLPEAFWVAFVDRLAGLDAARTPRAER